MEFIYRKDVPKGKAYLFSGSRRGGKKIVQDQFLVNMISQMKEGQTVAVCSIGETRILRLEKIIEQNVER